MNSILQKTVSRKIKSGKYDKRCVWLRFVLFLCIMMPMMEKTDRPDNRAARGKLFAENRAAARGTKVMTEGAAAHYLSYRIKKEESGQEVRSILYGKLKLTTRKIRALKKNSRGLLLNGEPVTVRQTVREGELLQIMMDDNPDISGRNHILPVPMDLHILYEDDNLLFMDKPAGMVCHPSKGHLTDTLCNGVSGYYEKTGQNAGIHLFGRLDKDTSGVVGIAKNKVTAERMQSLREQGLFRKEYLALVHGCPFRPSGTITVSMEEDRSEGILKMRAGTSPSAKKAVTHYQTLRYFSGGVRGNSSGDRRHAAGGDGVSLCRVLIETGRTHQIRFHMASLGCPLLGDPLYGDGSRKEKGMGRTALHAWKVRFPHPFTGEEVTVTAGLPEDLKGTMVRMKRGEKNATTSN